MLAHHGVALRKRPLEQSSTNAGSNYPCLCTYGFHRPTSALFAHYISASLGLPR